MKRFLIALLILAPLSSVYSGADKDFWTLSITLFAGQSLSRYSEAVTPPANFRQEEHNMTGAAFGLGFEFSSGERFIIDVRLQSLRKGTRLEIFQLNTGTGEYERLFEMTYQLDTVDSSIVFKFKPLRRSSPYILAGFSFSAARAHRINSLDQISLTKIYDFGIVAGCGAELAFQKWAPFVEVRYVAGLNDLNKGLDGFFPTIRTRALVLMAGIKIRLKI